MPNKFIQPLYSSEGKEMGKVELAKEVFGVAINYFVVSQVILALQKNKKQPTAHTKDRGETRGGGAKPWRQKGTGRARHGSIRSPIWRGGGVTHGPTKDKNRTVKINSKVKDKVLRMIMGEKSKAGEIIFLDKINLKDGKTKELRNLLKEILPQNILGDKSLAIVASVIDDKLKRSSANLPNVYLKDAKNLNSLDVLSVKYLVFTKSALQIITKRLS